MGLKACISSKVVMVFFYSARHLDLTIIYSRTGNVPHCSTSVGASINTQHFNWFNLNRCKDFPGVCLDIYGEYLGSVWTDTGII